MVHDRGEPVRAVAVVETPDGTRTVAVCAELDVAGHGPGDWSGRSVHVATAGRFVLV